MRLNLNLTLLLSFLASTVTAQNWEQVSPLPAAFNKTHHSFAFSFNNLGYIVTGSSDTGVRDDFYEYNPNTDSWTALSPFPGGARSFAIGDTWDGKAYFGFGYNGTAFLNDLWVFDPSNMSWTTLAPCPCSARAHPALVAHNGKVFVGLGRSATGDMKDWWEYDISLNTWSQKSDLPSLKRHHPYQFGIDNKIYTGLGHGNGIFNNWFSYDITNETWSEMTSLPGEGRVAGTQFSYEGIGYVLSGDGDDHNSMETGEFWAYNPLLNNWEQLLSHPGSSRWAPASFIINGEVYVINGTSFSEYISDVYKFDLDESLSQIELSESNFSIYPNPAINSVNINVLPNIKFSISILDFKGRLINNFLNKTHLDIQILPKGLYLLEFTNLETGKKTIERLIKKC